MYVDLNLVQTYNPGDILTAAALQQARLNGEFFIDPPACSIYSSTPQLIPDDDLTAMSGDIEQYDNDSMHSTSSDTTRITCQTPGRYLLTAVFEFSPSAAGHRQWDLLVNGTTAYGVTRTNAVNSGVVGTFMSGSRTLILAPGDYVEARVLQNSGGVISVTLHEFAALFLTR